MTLYSRVFILGFLACCPAWLSAATVSPPPGYRPPVISKLQIVFSLVSHQNSIADRVAFYNARGVPLGNANYAVPHLVYEPIVTLYNPYNDALVYPSIRLRIADPPVGFRFKKNSDYLRPEWSTGEFHGLGRFQISNQYNVNARKSFTLFVRDKNASGVPGGEITIPPGKTMTFSTWVESNWTWGLEVAKDYYPRSFFDMSDTNDFTNRDNRTSNAFGVECMPQYFQSAFQAGFQTDHLSYSGGRPPATVYPFELSYVNYNSGWVAIRNTDTVTVEAKALRTAPAASSDPDFQVDLLAGKAVNPAQDTYQSFKFSVTPLVQNNGNSPATPAVTRTFMVQDLLQTPTDFFSGGKSPFAVFTMVAKSSALTRRKLESLAPVSDANALYDLRFDYRASSMDWPEVGPSDPLPAATTVFGASRKDKTMTVDFLAPPGLTSWAIKGGTNLVSFSDDLKSSSTIVDGPAGTGIKKAIVDVSGKGAVYFIRLEGSATP